MWGRSIIYSCSISAYLLLVCSAWKLGYEIERKKFSKLKEHVKRESLTFIKNNHAPLNLRLLLARSTLDNDSILNGLPFDLIQMIGEKISSVYIEEIHSSQRYILKSDIPASKTTRLYENQWYFSNLSYHSSLPHSYFICKHGKCAPSTWGSDVNEHYDKEHPSNINKLLPTFHEMEYLIYTGRKLWGTFTILDTRVSEYDPPVINVKVTGLYFEGGITKKIKLPPDWRPFVDVLYNTYCYLDEFEKKLHSKHPYPDLMDIMVKKLDSFRKPSENFTRDLDGNMKLDRKTFYDILDSS